MAQSSNKQQASSRSQSQPAMSGWVETAKGRPIATAAAVGGAVAAGAFLWSQRDRIGSQVGHWSEKMRGQHDGSSSHMSGHSSVPMGAETRSQPDIATGTGSTVSSPRAQATTSRTQSPMPSL